jgi:methyl-accepting chemotaxis protein
MLLAIVRNIAGEGEVEPNSQLAERLRFARLDADAIAALREIKPIVQPAIPGILKEFYEHLAGWPDLMTLFRAPASVDRAARRQSEHWSLLLSADFGEAYAKSARQVGETHARIGLDPQWYIAGYTFASERITALLARHFFTKAKIRSQAERERQFARCSAAFSRAAMLDLDICLDVYLDVGKSATARAKRLADAAVAFGGTVERVVDSLAGAAGDLERTASGMSSVAESTSSKAVSVSAAAEQATGNVRQVAASAEQMGQSVSEIAGQVGHASRIASSAVVKARSTNETMAELSKAADKIGEVVSLIADIAAQTNLLALNATIESARAGEAGRGFAVVASEVKSLAGQTSKATEEISSQIAAMQAIARTSVEAIAAIQTTINEIDTVSAAINAAVEEQTAMTREIARNTHEAAAGTQDVTRNINDVQRGAADTGEAAGNVVGASRSLSQQAEQLRRQVSDFLASIRAA